MKLPIKKKYFEMISDRQKTLEFRDAHITFVCEETGRTFKRSVVGVTLVKKKYLGGIDDKEKDVLFEDDTLIRFELG